MPGNLRHLSHTQPNALPTEGMSFSAFRVVLKLWRTLAFRLRPIGKWHAIAGYHELHRVLSAHGLPSRPQDFTAGPLRRFFDLALLPRQSAGLRCRILEHGRHWAYRAGVEFSDDAEALALADGIRSEIRRLAALGPAGRWVITVFEGDYTHHAAPEFPDQYEPDRDDPR